MIIIAYFSDAGVPKTGLTPTINIWDSTGTLVVEAANMSEVGGGFYKYNFTTYDDSKVYCFRADGGVSLADTDRYVFTSNELGQVTQTMALETTVQLVKTQTDRLSSEVIAPITPEVAEILDAVSGADLEQVTVTNNTQIPQCYIDYLGNRVEVLPGQTKTYYRYIK